MLLGLFLLSLIYYNFSFSLKIKIREFINYKGDEKEPKLRNYFNLGRGMSKSRLIDKTSGVGYPGLASCHSPVVGAFPSTPFFCGATNE